MRGGFAAGSLRAGAVVLGCLLAVPATAEKIESLAAARPAPGNERRVALVIGNSAYKSSPLRNPANDARAMARALADTGFSVRLVEDATLAGMRRVIREFGTEIARGGVGLFYYAGHGMQVRGKNYLIPVNADVQAEDEVEDQGVDANFVLAKMDSAKNSLNILILDACRNNPFARSFRSATLGLAQMDAPSGTLVAFATAPGSVAADGAGDNGLYTKHLLKVLRQPGLPVEQLFKQVRVAVSQETGDRQVPWESSSLKGNFHFVPPDTTRATEELRRRQEAARALAEAMRQSEERAAQEREELRRRMEQLLQDGTPAPAAAPAPAPQLARVAPAAAPAPAPQLARVAPAAAPAAPAASAPRGGLPAAGDRWTYRRWRTDQPQSKSDVNVEIREATPASVLEVMRYPGRVTAEFEHVPGAYLVGWRHGDTADFAPYLGAFAPFSGNERWSNVAGHALGACATTFYTCTVTARVAGRERVSVPAGSFDTTVVEAQLIALAMNAGPNVPYRNFTRTFTAWYADEAKRAVKYRTRNQGGDHYDEDVELVAFSVGGRTQAVAPAAPEPVRTAGTAPLQVAAAAGLPQRGERWVYRLQDPDRAGSASELSFELRSAAQGEIVEAVRRGRGAAAEAVHVRGAYLAAVAGSKAVEFSPYLGAFEALQPGAAWSPVALKGIGPCASIMVECTARARAVARERVTVPAGAFDAIRVEVDLAASNTLSNPTNNALGFVTASARFTYWFAEGKGRVVKYSVRGDRVLADHLDVELVSHVAK